MPNELLIHEIKRNLACAPRVNINQAEAQHAIEKAAIPSIDEKREEVDDGGDAVGVVSACAPPICAMSPVILRISTPTPINHHDIETIPCPSTTNAQHHIHDFLLP